MLSAEKWWDVIRSYNQFLFPVQWILVGLSVFLVIYLFRGGVKRANVLLKGYLSLCFLWIGIFFFMVLGTGFPSPLKYIQGALFISIGVVIFGDIFLKKIIFRVPDKGVRRNVFIGLLLLVQLYPIIGIVIGRQIDELIYPGTLPCATTALALVLLTGALPKVNWISYILLLLWAIPFAPLIQIPKFHVYEDSIMFIGGIYAFIALVVSRIKSYKKNVFKLEKDLFDMKKETVFATVSDGGVPNVVPIHSKHRISDKKILISDQFMKKTLKNVLENPYAEITINNGDYIYNITGRCVYKTAGFMYNMAVRGAKKYARTKAKNKSIKIHCKGIILLTISKVEKKVVEV
jgi:hypothetical protein